MKPEAAWQRWSYSKVIEPKDLEKKCRELRFSGKLVTINGSFDLLHAGHLFMLYEAKQQGDILIVALNSDSSIKAYKSKDRPIIPLKERLEMISAIVFVDYITWFDETDPRNLLEKIKPDVHVNGAEYGENCIEAETVRSNGGRLHLLPRIGGLATSDIIKKIKSLA